MAGSFVVERATSMNPRLRLLPNPRLLGAFPGGWRGLRFPEANEDGFHDGIDDEFGWLDLAAPAGGAPDERDYCKALCSGVFADIECGVNGSYCKNDHACHDLYWLDGRSFCSRTRNPEECTRDKPIVSCTEAKHIHTVKITPANRPAMDAPAQAIAAASPLYEFGRRGFNNLGATCYLSATLQLLTHTAQLRDLVMETQEATGVARGGTNVAIGEAYQVIRSAFTSQWDTTILESDSGFPITARNILNLLAEQRGYGFVLGQMEDADDSMKTIMGLLEDALRIDERSPMDELFGITMRKERRCAACHDVRVYTDETKELSVPIPAVVADENGREPAVSLADCMAAYFQPETVEQVECESGICRPTDRPNADLFTRFEALPPLLAITLKRFRYMPATNSRVRINTSVTIPMEMDMAEMAGGGDGRYRLVGLILHIGSSLEGGHYITHIRHPEDGFFYNANDDHFAPIPDPALSGSSPYILMYERI